MENSENNPDQPNLSFFKEIETRVAEESSPQFEGNIWTHRKALLIQEYLRLFTMITYRGTYIDGFAGPQDGQDDSKTWAARKVWESNPGKAKRRITRFELFELGTKSHRQIRKMLDGTEADGREIFLQKGNCNEEIPRRLIEAPISGAAFCLLDQRSDECDWATVETVAKHKADPYKIEIFYFLMGSWYDRYRAGLGSATRRERLKRWCGSKDFPILDKASPERAAELFSRNFKELLNYKHVKPYPIFDNISPATNGTCKFYMIHATDHDEAPKFMRRAYKKLASGWDPNKVQDNMDFLDGDLKGSLSEIRLWDERLTDSEKESRAKRRKGKRG